MRLPRPPILYPTGIVVGFVLAYVEQSRVSPWAGVRATAIAVVVTLVLTGVATAVLRDRDRGALLALVAALLFAAGGLPWMGLLLTSVLVVLLAEGLVPRARRLPIRWPLVTRAMRVATAVLLLAILIRGVQDGRALPLAGELLAEAPGHLPWPAEAGSGPTSPDVYLVLLDGYPRADKLAGTFGFDNAQFMDALRSRGFAVAMHSRSNYPATRMTLASMFNGAHLGDLPTTPAGKVDWRRSIDEGTQVALFRSAGYRIVSFSSGYEDAVLRRVDAFIDTGQVGELERALLALSVVRAVAPDALFGFLVRSHGERIAQTFDAALRVASEGGPSRFVFVHVGSPHAPIALAADGSAIDAPRAGYPFDDGQEAGALGKDYDRLLGDQIEYLNGRTLELVDAIRASRPDAIVVVFSDHGSGVEFADDDPLGADLDLRTANLLAVRAPAGSRLIDDRSTLVNVLPRIAHLVLGSPLHEASEDIRVYPDEAGSYVTYDRPD